MISSFLQFCLYFYAVDPLSVKLFTTCVNHAAFAVAEPIFELANVGSAARVLSEPLSGDLALMMSTFVE